LFDFLVIVYLARFQIIDWLEYIAFIFCFNKRQQDFYSMPFLLGYTKLKILKTPVEYY